MGSLIVQGTDWSSTFSGGGSGASFTPFYVGKFNVGTNGQQALVEYTGNSALGSNNTVYSSDVPGPFGETKVGKVQLLPYTTDEYYYGGFVRTPSAIPATTGAEMWARAYFRFPTNWCNGGQGSPPFPESVNGAIKFFRLFFDTSNRLTLMLGDQRGGAGSFPTGASSGTCALPSASPILGMANSEIGSTNHFASTLPVMTRDQWWAIQWYVKFGDPNVANGIFRAWVNDTRVIDATNVKTRPSTAPTTVAQGFAMPGDLWNGGPGANNPFYVANMIMATSASPPTTLDSGGAPYIPSSVNALLL